jgi:hypothetical protein
MTMLEEALSKPALERLDMFRKQRGIRTRRDTLETRLTEAVDDEADPLTEEEIKLLEERRASALAGNTVSGEELHAMIRRQST